MTLINKENIDYQGRCCFRIHAALNEINISAYPDYISLYLSLFADISVLENDFQRFFGVFLYAAFILIVL